MSSNHESLSVAQEAAILDSLKWNITTKEFEFELMMMNAVELELPLLLTAFEKRFKLDLDRLRLFPDRGALPFYFATRVAEGTKATIGIVFEEAGKPRHTRLPNSDELGAAQVAYDNIVKSAALDLRMIKNLREKIGSISSNKSVFHGLEDKTPFKEILSLRGLITENQKETLASVLLMKQGQIDLKQYPKCDASLILKKIHQAMIRENMRIDVEQLKQIIISCEKGQFFPWYGKGPRGGKKMQDQVDRYAKSNSKTDDNRVVSWYEG